MREKHQSVASHTPLPTPGATIWQTGRCSNQLNPWPGQRLAARLHSRLTAAPLGGPLPNREGGLAVGGAWLWDNKKTSDSTFPGD